MKEEINTVKAGKAWDILGYLDTYAAASSAREEIVDTPAVVFLGVIDASLVHLRGVPCIHRTTRADVRIMNDPPIGQCVLLPEFQYIKTRQLREVLVNFTLCPTAAWRKALFVPTFQKRFSHMKHVCLKLHI